MAAHPPRFLGADGHADIAVVVVTYNNADQLPGLLASLHGEAADLDLRVIVADNGSSDETWPLLLVEPDLLLVDTGGNLGYAGGVNAACRRVGDARAVLVLNPDLVVQRGALRLMLNRMTASDAGAVVPQLLDTDGATYHSLRREPSLTRAVGDALLGSAKNRRPEWFSEFDVDPASYRHAHRVDWATGAAVLVRRDLVAALGDWDERFFLYSEETDYLRRLREEGSTVWYEPEAQIRHDQGGSGTSVALSALLAVNRVRYVQKHRPPVYAAAFHAAVALHEALRSADPVHRATLRAVIDRSSWGRLPQASLTDQARPGSPAREPRRP